MLSLGTISNEKDNLLKINYDNNNINTELQIKNMKKNLLNDICFESNPNNNISMETKSENDNDNEPVDENYFEIKEQINEIKINIYYALSLDFQFFRDFPSRYYILFPNYGNEVKAKRLIAQNFYIDNKKMIYKNKDYVFVPIQATSLSFIFKYNGEVIYFIFIN